MPNICHSGAKPRPRAFFVFIKNDEQGIFKLR